MKLTKNLVTIVSSLWIRYSISKKIICERFKSKINANRETDENKKKHPAIIFNEPAQEK